MEIGNILCMTQVLNVPRMLHGVRSVSSVPCSSRGEILEDKSKGEAILFAFKPQQMMDVQKYFSEAFLAGIAKQEHPRGTELLVEALLHRAAVLSDALSEHVCQDVIHQELPATCLLNVWFNLLRYL